MEINLIVANSQNGVIGNNNSIPWENPKDLKRFKTITDDSYVIMGRKTFESIGKPLSNRTNIVISKTVENIPGARVFKNFEDVIVWLANQELAFPKVELKAFVIGGGEIYRKFLKEGKVDTVYQTVIKKDYPGDVFFNFIPNGWEASFKEVGKKEEFIIWKKKKAEV